MIALTLTNQAEMVFSTSAATEGMHASLGYIPGATLWGALAARIYADGALRARSFDLVHRGKLRVSPGYPLSGDGMPAFPWPQCLQQPKHESGRRLWNMLDGPLKENGAGADRATQAGRLS